jgi:aspartyl-tRNA(Asn)/glutamyl-tRNA(Gln) amidotransferase subunit A
MAGYDEQDPNSFRSKRTDFTSQLDENVEGLRVGVPTNYFFERCDSEVVNAVNSSVKVLESIGCELVEFEFPNILDIMAACMAIDLCESSSFHEQSLRERPGDFQPDVREYLEQGLFVPATYYIKGLRTRATLIRKITRLFKQFDAIVTPTEPIVAPEIGRTKIAFDDIEEDVVDTIVRFTGPFNLLGLPALSIPCGFSRENLPIGMQIVGNLFEEPTILRLGNAFEKATPWHERIPTQG